MTVLFAGWTIDGHPVYGLTSSLDMKEWDQNIQCGSLSYVLHIGVAVFPEYKISREKVMCSLVVGDLFPLRLCLDGSPGNRKSQKAAYVLF